MRTLVIIGVLLVSVAGAERAWAREPSPAVRTSMELAVLEGRARDVATIRKAAKADGPLGLWPQAVLDLWWRPDPSVQKTYEALVGGDVNGLMGERYRWLFAAPPRGDYPMPTDGATDPYPVLSALILDRVHRDRIGLAGLPERSPLNEHREHPNERVAWFANAAENDMARTYYGGLPPRTEDVQLQEKADELEFRNGLLALAMVLLLVLVPIWIGRKFE